MISRRSLVGPSATGALAATAALAIMSATIPASPAAAGNSYSSYLNIVNYAGSNSGGTWDGALNAAVAALPSNGGAIYFPSGYYQLSSTHTISSSNVTLFGDGPFASVIQSTSWTSNALVMAGFGPQIQNLGFQSSGSQSGGYYITLGQPGSSTAGSCAVVSNVQMSNGYGGICIYSSDTIVENVVMTNISSNATGILVNSQSSGAPVRLRNIIMSGPGTSASYGILVTNCQDLNITDCDIDNMNIGLALLPGSGQSVASVRAINCYFDGGSGTKGQSFGILIEPTSSSSSVCNCVFTGCWTSNTTSNGVCLNTPYGGSVYNIDLIGLQVLNSSGSGLSIGSSAGAQWGITVSGGLFKGNAYGLYVNPNVTDFTVQGAKFDANTAYQIFVSPGGSIGRFNITNNNLRTGGYGSIYQGGGWASPSFIGPSASSAGANITV